MYCFQEYDASKSSTILTGTISELVIFMHTCLITPGLLNSAFDFSECLKKYSQQRICVYLLIYYSL